MKRKHWTFIVLGVLALVILIVGASVLILSNTERNTDSKVVEQEPEVRTQLKGTVIEIRGMDAFRVYDHKSETVHTVTMRSQTKGEQDTANIAQGDEVEVTTQRDVARVFDNTATEVTIVQGADDAMQQSFQMISS